LKRKILWLWGVVPTAEPYYRESNTLATIWASICHWLS
jgi:hypothetical protein